MSILARFVHSTRHLPREAFEQVSFTGTIRGGLLSGICLFGLVGCTESENPPPTKSDSSRQEEAAKADALLVDSADIQLAGSQNWRSWDDIDDPSRDGWNSEALHNQIKEQLTILGQQLVGAESPSPEALAPLLANDFRAAELRPDKLEPALQDQALVVERGSFIKSASPSIADANSLAQAFDTLTQPLRKSTETHHKFKVFRLDQKDGGVETEQFLSLSGQTPDGFFEQHATWTTRWELIKDSPPKLKSIRVTEFEQIRAHSNSRSLFSDCTDDALRDTACYQNQILQGANRWFRQIPRRTMLNLFSLPGIAVGDVNGDGLDDLYLCQDPGIPNRLFLQNRDGTAREVSADWGVDWLEDSRSPLLVDLDNDGDQDLVVALYGNLVIAENEGQKRFRVRTALTPSNNLLSLSAFDYDLDGRLDLYVCAYDPDGLMHTKTEGTMGAGREQFVFHDANDGGSNSLFRNRIEPGKPWQFEDVTMTTGLDANNQRWSFAATAEDYDNDGDQDLYVANDYGRDNLYRNDLNAQGDRVFVDVSHEANIEDSSGGMGVTWGDYNRDGWMDCFVSNMWSSAGLRVTNQKMFKADASDEVRRRIRNIAAGNTLMRNTGKGSFETRSQKAGVEMGRWAWGNRFFDMNNDGWEDLIVANGYMTNSDSGDL